jgi:hypothetical protein
MLVKLTHVKKEGERDVNLKVKVERIKIKVGGMERKLGDNHGEVINRK